MKRIVFILVLFSLLLSSFITVAYADDYFILNTESGKYHRNSCDYLPSYEKRERIDAYELESELKRYSHLSPSPCLHCDPLDYIGDDYEEYEDPVDETDSDKNKRINIIIFCIIAVGVIFSTWLVHHDEKIRNECHVVTDNIKKESDESYQRYLQEYNRFEAEKEELKLYVICATFDCSLQRAKKIYNTLYCMHKIDEFIEAESNEHRAAIYEEALDEYNVTYIE